VLVIPVDWIWWRSFLKDPSTAGVRRIASAYFNSSSILTFLGGGAAEHQKEKWVLKDISRVLKNPKMFKKAIEALIEGGK